MTETFGRTFREAEKRVLLHSSPRPVRTTVFSQVTVTEYLNSAVQSVFTASTELTVIVSSFSDPVTFTAFPAKSANLS